MQLDIFDFLERLRNRSINGEMAAETIYREIRRAENLKVGFMDLADKDPAYFAEISSQLDTYIFELQELEKQLNPGLLPPDQRAVLQDDQVREKIAGQILKLRQLKNKK